jgi:riboflavin transporter FmnP
MISTTRRLTMAAFLAALSIVLTRYFSILVPLQGVPSLSVELGGVPIMISGIFLGQ